MAGQEFICSAKGKDAYEAFRVAVREAQFAHRHAKNTGTIADKMDFKMIMCQQNEIAISAAIEAHVRSEESPIKNPFGPAGCIDAGNGEYIFFGVALRGE